MSTVVPNKAPRSLRLFYNPGSCSLASHVALEESGLKYETELINLRIGAQQTERYLAINPVGRVPALTTDGVVLTENVAIINFVAELVPERILLPPAGSLERIRALEWMVYLASTVHVGFRPVFRPERFARTDAGIAEVRETGALALSRVLEHIDARLEGREYAIGGRFTLVDAYLLVFHQWSRRETMMPPRLELPNLSALAARVAARKSVQTVLAAEGLSFCP